MNKFSATTAAVVLAAALTAVVPTGAAHAQEAPAANSLALYFPSGSTTIRRTDLPLLDRAARLYRDGHPIIMVLSGSTDTVGSPESNLRLSQARADAVLQELVARGIPAERFQLLAKGQSELPISTGPGVTDERNRRVEISWR